MRYFHLRNPKGELIATLAGTIKNDVISYGTAVVGSNERKVSRAAGRAIAESRVGKMIYWNEYECDKAPNPTITLLRSHGIERAGRLPMAEFIARVRIMREVIVLAFE